MEFATSSAFFSTLALLLVACGSTTPAKREITLIPTTPIAPKSAPMVAPKTDTPVQKAAVAPYLNPQNSLYTHRSFYFANNSATLDPEFAEQVALHGKFLAANPTLTIGVEGGADQRGNATSNLALGNKRAVAVARALKAYGVADRQMKITSVGNYEPKAKAHAEASWSKNRRVDLIYPTM
jgi:peptidoglycan-associated lipoprotein